MAEAKPRAIAFFRTWERVRRRPIGRIIRGLRTVLDPVVYWAWYAYTWFSTRRPRTFNEKIRYKMVRDRRPILKTFGEKIAVRSYVERELGPQYLTTLYQIHESAQAIRWDDLPREFVCKVSHASGGVIIVSESASLRGHLPDYIPSGFGRYVVHPDAFDERRATALIDRWLTTQYGWSGWKREWSYLDARPRVMVEELLRGLDGGSPVDYKCHVFNGSCKAVEVHRFRFTGGHVADLYTRDWVYMAVSYEQPRSDDPQPPPTQLEEMLTIADELGSGTDYVRVDLYAVDGRLLVGEMTNYPAAGVGPFDPQHFDELLGSWWEEPARYE